MVTRGSDNPFPSVLFEEHVDPSNPSAGFQRLFVDTDHILKLRDSAGTVTTFGGGFSDPMTTRGDIIIRDSSNATARLGRGSAGQVLSSDGTDVSWQTPSAGGVSSGTSNPGSPSDGDLFYRTDLDLLIRYRSSGTRWVCTCPHTVAEAGQTALIPISATSSAYLPVPISRTTNVLIEGFSVGCFVNTTNDASKYWTFAMSQPSGATVSTQSLAANTQLIRKDTTAVVMDVTANGWVEIVMTKVSTPGTMYHMISYDFRYIVT